MPWANHVSTLHTFRAFSIPEPKVSPEARLEWALDLGRDRLDEETLVIVYVHPLTVAETPARQDVELRPRAEVGRFGYWFPTESDR